MCCIFTWLAWAFDATHRIVVFFMACMISSSICCLLLTASLAGVAMGYNYSLAEYIDLKETNISVYIKRGVYDDEISDDFDWRRSGGAGGQPNLIHKDTGLRTDDSDNQKLGGRRRMADSVFESDDEHKYEGSLMRLTATPTALPIRRFQPDPPYTTTPSTTKSLVDGLLAVADNLPGGSLDRLKVIEAAAKHHEARKIELATAKIPEDASEREKVILENAQIHDARRNDPITTTDKYAKYFNQLAVHPGFPGSGLSARKFMDNQQKDMETVPPNRFRDAVFRGQLSGWPTGASPKPTNENFFEYEMNLEASMPTAPTVRPLIVRPMGDSAPIRGVWETAKEPPRPILRTKPQDSKEEVYDSLKTQPKSISEEVQKKDRNDIDDDESQGLPSRKKRSNDKVSQANTLLDDDTLLNFDIQINNYNAKLLDTDSVLLKIDDAKTIQNKAATYISRKTEVYYSDSKANNTNKGIRNITLDENDDILVEQSLTKTMENATSSHSNQGEVPNNPRKRKKISKGYSDRNFGKKQIKSIWWKISTGAQEQWHRLISYVDKHILAFSTSIPKLDDRDKNTTDSKASTFIFNLLPKLNNKAAYEDKLDTNKKSNITTSIANISDKITPQTFIAKIIQSTIV